MPTIEYNSRGFMDDITPIIWAIHCYAVQHRMDDMDVVNMIEDGMEEILIRTGPGF